MFAPTTDNELIRRALDGSERAWLALIQRYEKRLYNYALRMSGNPDDAMDILQDCLMSVYRNLGSFRGEAKFSTWLFQIAAFRCTDYFRRRRREYVDDDTDTLPDPNAATMPDASLDTARDNQSISSLMQSLSPDQRQVIELKFFQHFTFDEIAGQLGISPNTAKTRLYAALEKMRRVSPVSLAAGVS
ncbi:MAG TPA: RNA polymerase sigma factor [Pseudomonadales bacterium]|nr:RNA polymerase sigma factor [Pseudomonadales bacterium]